MNVEITVRAETQEKLEENMARMLRKCGWNCEHIGLWLTPKEICAVYRIPAASRLSTQLRRFPDPFPAQRGASGRILRLQLSAPLKRYLARLNGEPRNTEERLNG